MTMRSWIQILALGFVWTGLSSVAAAGGSKIATQMGDLRWGMTESEVIKFAQREIGERYSAQLKKAPAAKQASLKDQMKREQSEIAKSRVAFEGTKSRWDSSPIAGEFNYGNEESMLVAKGAEATDYYFFKDGRLWKWYQAHDKSSVKDFKKFSSKVESDFGTGRAKKGELNPGQGETQWVEYLDRVSRMRAADNSKRGVYALIYEDMSVVREMASLRPTKPSRLAGADDEGGETVAPSKSKSAETKGSSEEQVARANTKQRSVFGDEKQEETETEYQSRKEKQRIEARERAARTHAKKEDQKQGETLKQLDKIEDDDPLSGL
jgi:hypothetical protein